MEWFGLFLVVFASIGFMYSLYYAISKLVSIIFKAFKTDIKIKKPIINIHFDIVQYIKRLYLLLTNFIYTVFMFVAKRESEKLKKIRIRRTKRCLLFLVISLSLSFYIYKSYVGCLYPFTEKYYPYWALAVVTALCLFGVSISYISRSSIKYAICPNCEMSTLLIDKWQCRWCNSIQPSPVSFVEKCCECGRYQKVAYCEHCKQEFRI
jgi:hypothetical protein